MYLYTKYHGKLFTKCKAGYRMIQPCRFVAHHQGAVHTVHTHTHALAHARSLLETRVPTLRNLAAWEMFILTSNIHLGGGRSPRCIGLNSTRLLQAAAWKRFCLQGPTAWCGRGGEGGILELSSPGSSAGAHGQELELRGRLMLQCKSENVSG